MVFLCPPWFLPLSKAALTSSLFLACSQEYAEVVAEGKRHVLLDVRKEVQFAVCALDKAVNVPLSRLEVNALRAPAQLPRSHARIPLCYGLTGHCSVASFF